MANGEHSAESALPGCGSRLGDAFLDKVSEQSAAFALPWACSGLEENMNHEEPTLEEIAFEMTQQSLRCIAFLLSGARTHARAPGASRRDATPRVTRNGMQSCAKTEDRTDHADHADGHTTTRQSQCPASQTSERSAVSHTPSNGDAEMP